MMSSKIKIVLLVVWHIVAAVLLVWTAKPKTDEEFIVTYWVYALIVIEVGIIGVWGGVSLVVRAYRQVDGSR